MPLSMVKKAAKPACAISPEQRAVLGPSPTHALDRGYLVSDQVAPEAPGKALVEEDTHAGA